jgi:anthranilate 1,2-dioxygenase small subunit
MHGDLTMSREVSLDLRSRCEALIADCAHAIDDDQLEQWPDFFVEKCTYRVTTRENHDRGLPLALVYCDGRGMMADRISALRTANIYEPHHYCHILGPSRVTRDGDTLRARTNFSVIRTMASGDAAIFATGRCIDEIVEEGGAMKFRARLVVLDSRQIDTLLVIPI